MASQRLALGTVQFGLRYGIANHRGQMDRDAARAVLALARTAGIDTLDTAIAYGDSETCLGEAGTEGFRIVTKLPSVPGNVADVGRWAHDELQGSLRRLGVRTVYGLLLHRSQQLVGPEGQALGRALERLKAEGLARKIGVSIYDPLELDACWPHFRFDLVQVPFNILDRRLVTTGWLSRLNQAGVEVHARSVFLQGLLLMDAANRPSYFQRWRSLWSRWRQWLADNELTPLQASLRFVLSQPGIDRVIVGVDSPEHLRDILAVAEETDIEPPSELISVDPDLINPSRWKTN